MATRERRHLTKEERDVAILAAVSKGESERAVAERFGVSQDTVHRAKGATERVLSVAPQPTKVTGLDGKVRPATKPTPEQLEERVERVAPPWSTSKLSVDDRCFPLVLMLRQLS